jgi:hypothetical protein
VTQSIHLRVLRAAAVSVLIFSKSVSEEGDMTGGVSGVDEGVAGLGGIQKRLDIPILPYISLRCNLVNKK